MNSYKKHCRHFFGLLVLCIWFCIPFSSNAAPYNYLENATLITDGTWITTPQGIKLSLPDNTYVSNSWVQVDEAIYHFNKNEFADTGFFSYKGNKYYANRQGKVYSNYWIKIARKTYYLDEDGTCPILKWKKINDKYYFFDASGALVTNRWISNKYYVGSDGARKTSCVVDNIILDENGRKTDPKFNGKYFFIGDSRMVGMQEVIAPPAIKYLAKKGQGYTWFRSSVYPILKCYLKANPKVKVVLALGVNDLGHLKSYLNFYQKLIAAFPETRFYLLSVNPVDEELKQAGKYKNHSSSTARIKSFNKALKKKFGKSYIDSYTYLMKTGFSTVDGLHYDAATYKKLYRFIITSIR